MLIIGICGASGSGKSTLTRKLREHFAERCIDLKQDSYYRSHPDMPFEERENINYDEPNAFEHDSLLRDLQDLRAGKAITAKNYDYTMHLRADTGDTIEPKPLVILEGIHAFYDEAVRNAMDLRIYVQVDPDVCLMRRVKRDMRDRGRSVESIYKQYLETVKPMYDKYIKNYVDYADIVVPRGGKSECVLDLLIRYIESRLAEE